MIEKNTHISRSRSALLWLAIVCAGMVFMASAPSAHAATFSKNFCSPGSASGQCDNPAGAAVDQAGGPGGAGGTVYVVDQNNFRVDAFDTEGRFLMAFGTGVLNGADELQTCTTVCGKGPPLGGAQLSSVAVDQSSHDLYLSETLGAVQKLAYNSSTQKFELLLSFGGPGSGPGQLDGQLPLVVDPATHDLWIGQVDRIQKFSETGEFLTEIQLPGKGIVRSLARTAGGDLYAVTDPNFVQRVTPPVSGTYTLTAHGHTTAPLSAGAGSEATAVEVEAALFSAIGAHNFRVEGPKGGPFLVELYSPPGVQAPEWEIGLSDGSATVTQEGGLARQVDRLSPTGNLLETLDSGGHPQAVTLDPATENLFVGDCQREEVGTACQSSYSILEFDPAGAQIEAFGGGEVTGGPQPGNSMAFSDGVHRLFLASGGGAEAQILTLPPPGPLVENKSTKASAIRKVTATLEAEVNPEGAATTYRFQYITEAKFKEDGEQFGAGTEETPLSASLGEDFSFHKASAAVSSLDPATAYRLRVLAFNVNGPAQGTAGETASFETLPPADVDASVADVTASSATLLAQINPLGEAAAYRFEYLTAEAMQMNEEAGEPSFAGAAQAPLEPAPIGSGEEAVPVSQHLQGLVPHTAYRYRVVVSNPVAPQGFATPVRSFTTQASAAAALADGRAWELVSPTDKHGALILPILGEGVIQASPSGDAITYVANAPAEPEPQGYGQSAQVLSRRGSDGWRSSELSPPHAKPTAVLTGQGLEYFFFSSDLSQAALQPRGPFEPALSAEATEQTPFLRSTGCLGTVGCFRPLLTPSDVTSGVPFGVCPEISENQCGAARLVGTTGDFSHIVLRAQVGLTSAAGDHGGLYDWSNGQLRLLSVLPSGAPAPPSSEPDLGNGGFNSERGAMSRSALSEDATRVVWSTGGNAPDALYLRDTGAERTLRLDTVQGGPGGGVPGPRFQIASFDDSRIFFTDTQSLTADSGARSDHPDLYECRIVIEEGGDPHCSLTDLTPARQGESADVLGSVIGSSQDGSFLYFVANGSLTSDSEPGDCRLSSGTPSGECNLYLDHEGSLTLLARLSGRDSPTWDGLEPGNLPFLTARVSPDGRWLAFMSSRSLTGYDNRDAASGKADQEVFLYHAAENGAGSGQLICASCNPTGARPHGVPYGDDPFHENMPLAGGVGIWTGVKGTWIAANVPGWTPWHLQFSRYQSRYLSDSGRLFFNARDALVPQDTNGTTDVYEYEPPQGPGSATSNSCNRSDPAYSSAAAGCISLISSGTSPEESAFLDASESGDDVFFLTNSRLSPLDVDGARDVYDAHVCTAESPCPPPSAPPPPACEGDGCQLPATPPQDSTPTSLNYQGPGNEVQCPKGKVKKSGKCVAAKKHKKAYKKHRGTKHKRPANTNRRAGK